MAIQWINALEEGLSLANQRQSVVLLDFYKLPG